MFLALFFRSRTPFTMIVSYHMHRRMVDDILNRLLIIAFSFRGQCNMDFFMIRWDENSSRVYVRANKCGCLESYRMRMNERYRIYTAMREPEYATRRVEVGESKKKRR